MSTTANFEQRPLAAILTFVTRIEVWAVIASVVLLVSRFASQLDILGSPIVGYHQWRGAATYSVAYNYVHTSWNFFYPRTDYRNAVPEGVTTMEMPGYVYICALAMRIFGDAPVVCRSVNFLAQLLAMGAWGYLAFRLRRPLLAVGLFCAWAIMPVVALEFRQIQPDTFLVSWALTAASFFCLYARLGRFRYYAGGFVAYTLACAAKPTAIAIAPAMVLFALGGRWLPLRTSLRRALPIALPVAMALAWQSWSLYLYRNVYGLAVFEIHLPLWVALKNLKDASHWQAFFSQWIPPQLTGQVGWPLMLVGMALSFSRRHRSLSLGFWAWFVGSLLAIAVTAHHVPANLYYLDPLLPPCAYFICLAVEAPLGVACGVARSGRAPWPSALGKRSEWVSLWAVGCVVMLWSVRLLMGEARVRADSAAGADFWFQGVGPSLLAGIFIGGVAIAEALPARDAVRKWSGVLACLILWTMVGEAEASAGLRARRLVKQSYGPGSWTVINQLRATVDRYSTRDDTIMVIGADPAYLHWPLRKGWVVSEDFLAGKVSGTAGHGQTVAVVPRPRLLIYYKHEGPVPASLSRWTALEDSYYWILFCTDPAGCRPRVSGAGLSSVVTKPNR